MSTPRGLDSISRVSIYYWYIISILLTYYWYIIDMLLVYYLYTIGILLVYYCYIIGILLVLLLVYYWYIIGILLVYYHLIFLQSNFALLMKQGKFIALPVSNFSLSSANNEREETISNEQNMYKNIKGTVCG